MSVLITTRAELEAMQPEGEYVLASDIDLSGAAWTPLFSAYTPFIGALDGAGRRLIGLTITGQDRADVGLMTAIGSAGQPGLGMVENVFLQNVSMTLTGASMYTGALTPQNRGTVRRCRVSGTIAAGYTMGMLVANNDGLIERCFADGSATNANPYNGGLAGTQGATGVLRDCFARVAVSGTSHQGGLLGRNSGGKVIRCYSTGRVIGTSSVGGLVGSKYTGTAQYEDTANFWDTQTSQRTTSACGVGKTTAQMKAPATFHSAGWDLQAVWGMHTAVNDGYPALRELVEFPPPPPTLRRAAGVYTPLRGQNRCFNSAYSR